MPNNQLIRDLGTLNYEAGETKELDLPRSHYFERLNLVANWTATIGTGGAQSGNGILDLIDRVEVQFNGDSTVKSTDFALSHFLDQYRYSTQPLADRVDYASATQQSGQLQTFVDFLLGARQYGALLPSFGMSDLTLKVKWATASNVGADVTVDSASIDVQSRERKKGTVAAGNPNLSTDDVVDRLQGFKERQRTVPLDYDGVHTVKLPKGNIMYAIGVQILDNDAPSETLIENVEVLENGVGTHKASTVDLLRAQDKQQYGIEQTAPGFFILNYGQNGDTDDVVSTAEMDSYELKLDTDGTVPTDPAEARIVTQEIVP